MFPQTLTGIQVNFAGDKRVRAIGLYAIALSSGAVAGQFLGGLLISANLAGTQWRSIFLINLPVGLLVILAGLRHLPPETHRTARRLDLVGVAALSVALVLFVMPLVVGRDAGWPAWIWVCLGLAVPAFGGFLTSQRRVAARGAEPLVAVSALARPAISWALVTLMIATGTYYALLFTIAQYLQHGRGYSPAVSGLTLVPWVAAFGLAGQLVRRLPASTARHAPAFGCLLLTAAYVAIAVLTLSGHDSMPLLVTMLGVGGLGLGVQFSALIAHLAATVPVQHAADISGVSGTVMLIGGAVSIATFGTLYLGLATDATNAFGVTAITLAAATLIASLAAYRATRPAPIGPPERATPALATPAAVGSRYSGSRNGPVASSSIITGTPIRNADPHQKYSSSAPPASGPTAARPGSS
jgi:MFS family permease